jgi:hypothetical protein
MNELIKKLNDLKITQTSEWEEDIPKDIYEEVFKNKKTVATGLFVDRHRWYELSIDVIEIDGKYLGVRHVSNVYSENMGIDDCSHTLLFSEMKAVQKTTYEIAEDK